MTAAERAALDVRPLIGVVRGGSLRVYGDWFGRPHDNWHVPVDVEAVDDDLIVICNEGERLTITAPADWEFGTDVFRIGRASRVVWRWYYYGRPQAPENLFTIEHWIESDGSIATRSDVDWYNPTFTPSLRFPAVELI